nr:hypothetical protein [uncultured Fluviicola sp.]
MSTKDLANLRKQIISDCVKRLNRLGFKNVNEQNIFEDEVYKVYFLRILLGNLGRNASHDSLIKEMILEIAQ